MQGLTRDQQVQQIAANQAELVAYMKEYQAYTEVVKNEIYSEMTRGDLAIVETLDRKVASVERSTLDLRKRAQFVSALSLVTSIAALALGVIACLK
jgi:hypothetical protein